MLEVGRQPTKAETQVIPPLVLIIGAPRSGTTWIGKIFDSHPDVLYRNEPDIVLRDERLPVLCPEPNFNQYCDIARTYLRRLTQIKTLKSSGTLPIFRKSYQTRFSFLVRSGIIFGLHLADLMTRRAQWPSQIPIPDCISRSEATVPTIVIKSVSARGRARVFAEAVPESKLILVLRHPCAQIASVLKGIERGKLGNLNWLQEVLPTEQASRLGLTPDSFESSTLIQKLAWHWVILNQKALDDLHDVSRLMIVRHEDIVAQSTTVTKELFSFSGLTLTEQTSGFISKSTTYRGRDRYFSVWKDSKKSVNKWRNTLSRNDQCTIMNICKNASIGKPYVI